MARQRSARETRISGGAPVSIADAHRAQNAASLRRQSLCTMTAEIDRERIQLARAFRYEFSPSKSTVSFKNTGIKPEQIFSIHLFGYPGTFPPAPLRLVRAVVSDAQVLKPYVLGTYYVQKWCH
jgi:hypothetical protein